MAEINFSCQNCGQSMVADAAAAGLRADCPNCGESLTIPAFRVSSPGGAAELAYVREQLEAFMDQCERLSASTTHLQVELKVYQQERFTLLEDLIGLRQERASLEAQWKERVEVASRQMALQEGELRDLRLQLEFRQSAMERLDGEMTAWKTRMEEESRLKQAWEQRGQAAEQQLQLLGGRLASAEAASSQFEGQLLQLREDLTQTQDGRRLKALSDRLHQIEGERSVAAGEIEHLRRELERSATKVGMLENLLQSARVDLARMEASSEADACQALRQDNALLRGILDRQKLELEQGQAKARRSRRIRIGVFLLEIILALAVVELAVVAFKMFVQF